MSHRLIYGAGEQTIRTVPIREGRAVVVASATAAIVDLRYGADSNDHIIAAPVCVVDPLSQVTATPSGRGTPDAWTLTLVNAAGVVAGARYLLTSGGRSEAVRVDAIDGTTLRLESMLPAYFAAGATLRGLEVAVAVPVAVTGEKLYLEAGLAVRWSFAGLPVYQEQLFLERAAPTPTVGPEAVLSLDATLATYLADGATIAGCLAVAQQEYQVDLLAAGFDDSRHLAGPIGLECVRSLAAWHALKHSSDPSAINRARVYRGRYDELRAAQVVGLTKAKVLELDTDNAETSVDVSRLFAATW